MLILKYKAKILAISGAYHQFLQLTVVSLFLHEHEKGKEKVYRLSVLKMRVPYSGFFSSVLKFVLFVLLLLRTNVFPHDQRACVGVWCMCARKRRKLN